MKNIIFFFVVSISLFFVACGPKTRDERIADTIEKINNDATWKNNIVRRAQEENMPLDTALYRNAVYVVDGEDGLHK